MTITETSDYIIVGELAADEQIDSNYTDIAAYYRDTYCTSNDVIYQSGQVITDVGKFAENNAYCITLVACLFVVMACHIIDMIYYALSPYNERR